MSVQLVSNISNLCDHNPPTSQTDGRHAIARPCCANRMLKTRVTSPTHNVNTRPTDLVPRNAQPCGIFGLYFGLGTDPISPLVSYRIGIEQGSSERVRYFAERVLNVRSDHQIGLKNAFRTRSFRRM